MSALRRFFTHPHVGLVLRLIVGITFLYASIYKIRDPATFARGVMDYRMLPAGLIMGFSVILPWVEAVAGIFLVLGWFRRGSAMVILIMLVMFIVAIAVAIARGIDISCGCFHATAEGTRVAWETLGRDVLLIIGTVPLVLMARTSLELLPRRATRRATA